MKFWDTSAILPLIFAEATTTNVQDILHKDGQVVVWWSSIVEGTSTLSRAQREGIITQQQLSELIAELGVFFESCTTVEPTKAVRRRAQRLLLSHPLKAADALQLAAALIACQELPNTMGFVSLDKQLLRAAFREGFATLP